MSAPEIYFVGDDAVAVKMRGRAARHSLAAALRASGQWIDVVPGKQDLTVQYDPLLLAPEDAARLLESCLQEAPPADEQARSAVSLHMRVDPASAPDLEAIAARNGLSPEEFLARIVSSPLLVDMMGFTAGFAYVAGVDPSLQAGRLPVPRQRVPAGSVGIISGQLGLYALAGPAGWPVIGQVSEALFDPGREAPFLLDAGMRIKLEVAR